MKLSARLALVAALLTAATAARADPPSYILIDADQGTVLADHAADAVMYPASTSKLMTAYVTFSALQAGAIKLTSPVKVSQNALDQPPSKMGFEVGTVMTVDNALKMLLVKSANDIAVAISESVGGKEATFVTTMNQAAHSLGMVSTHYDNPHGLPDPGQVTTARDMAVLARALWLSFPDYRSYLGIPAIKSGRTVLASENKLLERYRGTNGMKTGFTCSAGYNLVASATRDGRTLIAVVLGEDSWTDVSERAASLLNRGFNPPPFSLGLGKPELAAFQNTPSPGPAIDMQDHGICHRKPGQTASTAADDEQDQGSGGGSGTSSLEPRFVLMAPVVVRTGLTETKPAAKPAATASATGNTASTKTAALATPSAAKPPAAKPPTAAKPTAVTGASGTASGVTTNAGLVGANATTQAAAATAPGAPALPKPSPPPTPRLRPAN